MVNVTREARKKQKTTYEVNKANREVAVNCRQQLHCSSAGIKERVPPLQIWSIQRSSGCVLFSA